MLYQITDGTVTLGGRVVLSHVSFEIHGTEKIAVVGKNGVGKTTLLRLIAGEVELDRDDRRQGPGIAASRRITVGMLRQQVSRNPFGTVEEELLENCPCDGLYERERYEYEREYDTLFTGFGFTKEDKKKQLSSFSGGEQTKIALIRLLLSKPDILLLDEPTNHLDIQTIHWLENYLKSYHHAVVMVSHDRFFLDRTSDVVCELSDRKLTRYPGNYTHYREEKLKNIRLQQKAFERQEEEEKRLEALVERFKHKPRKASFARSKKKMLERMTRLERPGEDEAHIFLGQIEPLHAGNKWVFEADHLKIGYDRPLLEISIRIRRGQKIGVLGLNGSGKTTFLKTAAGLLPPVSGQCSLGSHIAVGYFDQHSAEIMSEKSVAEYFHDHFPALPEKEARGILGSYLFGGRDSSKRVSDLSGGEKARLVLAILLQSRPNFLILDEPTNHMDVWAKETLESAFQSYTGTLLFVSHDRYFISRVADALLIFGDRSAAYYPFGYGHYLERKEKSPGGADPAAQVKAEEQALVAGLRAVPAPERHRLREIPTEEAYLDWRLWLVKERMDPAGERVARLENELAGIQREWEESEAFWLGREAAQDYRTVQSEYEAAWEEWHSLCLEWYETAYGGGR